ncbi:MAG: tannase/feruloyl esterase family alpha/beta hydrolase [Ramlibacter sp.]|nr:tannase/feruloyl esterase family alpha/beta hydrolase [Ramlibacter sp.]
MNSFNKKSVSAALASAAILGLGLAACGGGGGGGDAAAPIAARTCAELNGMTIPATSIGLPTTGATVASSTVVTATGTGATAVGEYCKVLADIKPVDPTAPNIKFQINLPATWNNKAMMYGGGGFDGSIPAVGGNVGIGPSDKPTPLQRGYAVFGSDSGHQAGTLGSQDHKFGLNDEAERNFGGDAIKKTRDAAMAIINARYGTLPTRSYFQGGSTGGREALAAIQRWPNDWNGAIALYPAWNDMGAILFGHKVNRALAAPGAYPNQAKRRVIYDAAMAACDGLDGVVDGLISNQTACNATFNPAVVRCAGGADTGDTCLSDAQITALNVMNGDALTGGATFNFPLASGLQSYPGYNVWGADLGMASASPLQPTINFLALGTVQPSWPTPAGTPYITPFLDQFLNYAVMRNPTTSSNPLLVDPENPGPWAGRLSALSTQLDTSTDISAFVARGGKLLLAHGKQDVLVSTRATEFYYQKLQSQFGPAQVDNFARYYEIPGLGHAVSTAFQPGWDSVTALENWVENGTAPANQVITDGAGVPGRTRPLCDYPTFPKYKGGGLNVNLASSFTCASS